MEGSDDESVAHDSNSEFLYDDGDEPIVSGSDCEQEDDPMVIEPPEVRRAPYVIMKREEIVGRQAKWIRDAAELLDVSEQDSFVLLVQYGWELSRLQEDWFQNEKKVRERCGIALETGGEPSSSSSSTPACATALATCNICQEIVSELVMLDCKHGFCKACWTGYLHCKVDDGKASVQTRCPQHKCGRVVPKSFFQEYCDEERKKKYDEWCVRCYVDENPVVKWCPNPLGCPLVCENHGVDQFEIRCNCNFIWCWPCGEESHGPADCKTVAAWIIKNSAESENISWIMANTKKCPKCHKPIEKNQGCNHMICSKAGGCGYEFCWLCLGDWHKHGNSTGGYYQCNIYDKQAKEGVHVEEENTRQKAKHALDKYMFYFERFMNHDKAMEMTKKQEKDIDDQVQKLHDRHGFEIIELQFLYDALKQVRACRRVLKWTYVYGYYLEEAGPEKPLFEYLQKNLEEKTDKLHEMLERDLDQIISKESDDSEDSSTRVKCAFMEFRQNVSNFTLVNQNWLTKILADVGVGAGGQTLTSGCPQISSGSNASFSPLPRITPLQRNTASRKNV